jgi:hypothetical protein
MFSLFPLYCFSAFSYKSCHLHAALNYLVSVHYLGAIPITLDHTHQVELTLPIVSARDTGRAVPESKSWCGLSVLLARMIPPDVESASSPISGKSL